MLSVFLIIGAITGVMSGLFGIGGGVIVVPTLSYIFLHHYAIPNHYIMHMAVGTSLAIMIITTASSMLSHSKRGGVRWDYFINMLPGLLIGAILGALIAHMLPSTFLQKFFGIFLMVISVRMFFSVKPSTTAATNPRHIFVRAFAIVIGTLSSILGVGGGTIMVPYLLYCKVDMREAIGTSAACGFFIGVVATMSFMVIGSYSEAYHIEWATGYVYWPAFAGIALMSVFFAPIGVSFAHKVQRDKLRRFFSVFLVLMAIDMLFFR